MFLDTKRFCGHVRHPQFTARSTPGFDHELISFSCKKVNIAEQIGTNYLKFGIFLLEDSNGIIVDALAEEHHWKAERINMAILQRWLDGKGMKPVTWSTLITALQNLEHCVK